ncbi:MAG: Rieske 2Fe-2S domain-containing protein, partial [Chloroflexota bacterium]
MVFGQTSSTELQPAGFFVDPDIARAETLPARAFRDPDFHALELATIFSRNWLFVPQRTADELRSDSRSLAELLSLRGSHLPISLLDRPLFLQRDWEGRLRCFPNVCTHAWYPLVHGPGRERSIVCRQHGRRFDSHGRFLGQPGFEHAVPRDQDHLRDLPVAEWGQFLFASLETPPAPLDHVLHEVHASLACFPLTELQRRPQAAEVRLVAGNWKQLVWNYMDVFHLTYIHRAPGGLAGGLDMASYRTELYQHAAL